MAKKDAKVRGKEIVAELVGLAKTPELKAMLTQLADDEIFEALGDKTLKQDEFSRLANELAVTKATYDQNYSRVQQHERELTTWEVENREFVTIGREVQKAGGIAALRGTTTGGDPEDEREREREPEKIDTSKFVTKEDAARMLAQARGEAVGSARYLNAITSKLAVAHFTEFKEVLDVEKLYAFCDQVGLALEKGGYDKYVESQRHEATDKKHKEDIAEAKKQGAKEALEAQARGDGSPYLVGTGGEGAPVLEREPSVLDILAAKRAGKKADEAKAGDATSDVMAAVASYNTGVARANLGLGS